MLVKILNKIYSVIQNANTTYQLKQLKFRGENVVVKNEVIFICPSKVSLGDYTMVGERAYFRGGGEITIGKYCQIANNVIIVTSNHLENGKLYYDNVECKDVIIGDNVWIRSGAKILPGVSIGDNCIVGAGAVVTKNVENNIVVGGVPARKIRKIKMEIDLKNA